MSYEKTNWANVPNTTSPISATNLNKIEEQLFILSHEGLTNVDTIGPQGSGILVRFGSNCQLALSFVAQAAVSSVDILQFPNGFKPYIDFSATVIDGESNDVVGVAYYTASSNTLNFKTSIQNTTQCKLSVTYVTGDEPIQVA